ncbi:hypothetical protein [Rathayibacter toxicus]|uniref:hypothetical protein n=1 Tax=Rathayibacter toxicus TaxID=145458 RepID=UPI0004197EC6|nr:hypothetical protein [Rathayibacter toxicus]PPH81377.1 hypothetical protein C5D20_10405 [Rathayibacter toxicus]PPI65126.1 hypothetical protein C5D47_10355 [Rathayibacter toxicus]QOD08501.1 hypothetical protein AYW78_01040 [Rathayibacter toxicus]QOD10609.1 hypothetical protein BSG36_00980 [Rathayibacter toxicus]QWL25301.1 hypothetical protein E2R32_01035 [Rathayibacter toxicus]
MHKATALVDVYLTPVAEADGERPLHEQAQHSASRHASTFHVPGAVPDPGQSQLLGAENVTEAPQKTAA